MPQVRVTIPGLSKDRAPKLQAENSATRASYLRSLRGLRKGEDRAVFMKSTYHFTPFFCSPTETGNKKAKPRGSLGFPKFRHHRKLIKSIALLQSCPVFTHLT